MCIRDRQHSLHVPFQKVSTIRDSAPNNQVRYLFLLSRRKVVSAFIKTSPLTFKRTGGGSSKPADFPILSSGVFSFIFKVYRSIIHVCGHPGNYTSALSGKLILYVFSSKVQPLLLNVITISTTYRFINRRLTPTIVLYQPKQLPAASISSATITR